MTTASKPFDPNTAQNAIEIEKQFAVKAVEQAQTYWNLIEKVPPRELKLTKLDDEIYEHTLKTFPELAENDHAKLIKLDEDSMKSPEGKERWRAFIESLPSLLSPLRVLHNPSPPLHRPLPPLPPSPLLAYASVTIHFAPPFRYKKKITDYNFGSLIRTDARQEYGENNTIFVTRIQFYAIEIARNRLGLNDAAHELAKAEAAKERAQKEKEAKEAAAAAKKSKK
ncbi:Duf757 domain-containing protein [Mycena sanguinolenta]|uniref:Duf757 domain-containing protein n=1 Tax=Mycena sanguinolenta TaxID=230812 RepID=A0A8H6YTB9_9AGAR|nr:Duf757 domain-containing protein [Mycena sanguinolenta]